MTPANCEQRPRDAPPLTARPMSLPAPAYFRVVILGNSKGSTGSNNPNANRRSRRDGDMLLAVDLINHR